MECKTKLYVNLNQIIIESANHKRANVSFTIKLFRQKRKGSGLADRERRKKDKKLRRKMMLWLGERINHNKKNKKKKMGK